MSAWWLAAFALGWLAWALYEPTLLRIKRYRLNLPGWPADYPALKIAFLSDFHMGVPHMTSDRLRHIVERTNELRPDLILLGGDYVDAKAFIRRAFSIPDIAAGLAHLTARFGVFGILGNHDWKIDGAAIRRALEEAGIVMLENEARALSVDGRRLWIAGTAEPNRRTPDVPGTLRQVTDLAPVLLLAHDPVTFFDVPDRPALTLSGHTHGGQLSRLPLLGPAIIMSYAPLKWAYGHVVEKGRNLLVTGGIGTSGLPLRFLMRPEIVVIEIAARNISQPPAVDRPTSRRRED